MDEDEDYDPFLGVGLSNPFLLSEDSVSSTAPRPSGSLGEDYRLCSPCSQITLDRLGFFTPRKRRSGCRYEHSIEDLGLLGRRASVCDLCNVIYVAFQNLPLVASDSSEEEEIPVDFNQSLTLTLIGGVQCGDLLETVLEGEHFLPKPWSSLLLKITSKFTVYLHVFVDEHVTGFVTPMFL